MTVIFRSFIMIIRSKKNKKEFLKPRWIMYNFSCNKIVAIKAQIHFWNFKTSN